MVLLCLHELLHFHFPSLELVFAFLPVLTLLFSFYTTYIATIDHSLYHTLLGGCRDDLYIKKEWIDIRDYRECYLSIDRFFFNKI